MSHETQSSTADPGPSIYVAIPRIIGDLPAIGKDSRMTQGPAQYSYRGMDDIMPHIKLLFARHGVHVAPVYEVISDDEILVGSRGSKMTRVVVKGMFRFTASDGSHVVCQTIGEARDSGDKAFNKAMTAALKYALMQVLAIADGDDPDAHRPELSDGEQRGDTPGVPEGMGVNDKGELVSLHTPNFEALQGMSERLVAAGLKPGLAAWARDQGIDLRRGHDEDRLALVVERASKLLAEADRVDAEVDAETDSGSDGGTVEVDTTGGPV